MESDNGKQYYYQTVQKEDVKSMVPIWNQVVEEGVAFPQLETLSTAGGRRFLRGRVIVVSQRMRQEELSECIYCIPII